MVKVTGPCFSLDAQGTLAGAITYQRALKSRICRKKPLPRKSSTVDQLAVRAALRKAIIEWGALTSSQRAIWDEYTDPNGNTGYHAFMSSYISRTLDGLAQYELPPHTGYCLVGEYLVGELTVGGGFRPV